mmetsp:Transcript_33055/g.56173  ORF Transcript_33055/g.56173 Transcript_33055/m.56173 type:complete len:107 (-) Transcript_33055:19-339(-)
MILQTVSVVCKLCRIVMSPPVFRYYNSATPGAEAEPERIVVEDVVNSATGEITLLLLDASAVGEQGLCESYGQSLESGVRIVSVVIEAASLYVVERYRTAAPGSFG